MSMNEIVLAPDFIQGAVSIEQKDGHLRPWRLPVDRLGLFPSPDDGLVLRAQMPAGVRVRFETQARRVGLSFAPLIGEAKFDLVINRQVFQTTTVGAGEYVAVFEDLPAGLKTADIWLPPDVPVGLRCLLVAGDAKPAADRRRKWIAYGSSITHCCGAHSPARTWPAVAARKADLDLTCLGYGGQCHLDPMVARMIRDLPADFVSMKVGINIYGGGSLSPRTFKAAVIGAVQTIREKHPAIPIALISPIISPPRESTANAVGLTLQLMRDEVREAAERLAAHGDGNIHYFSGLDLFSDDMVEAYLPDLLHPNGDGYELMGENFIKTVLSRIRI